MSIIKSTVHADPWSSLKAYTSARIALGRTGTALPLNEVLNLRLAHAHAKDAVYSKLNKNALAETLQQVGLTTYQASSKARTRLEYLHRPDLGRSLHETSSQELNEIQKEPRDIAFVVADGLSATAVNMHASPVLSLLLPALQSAGLTIAPIVLVEQARVAIADEVGALLKARLSLILIGERPGLSAPYSMGAYLTYAPQPGSTDEARNCVSNIHAAGLGYEEAAQTILYLIKSSLRLQLSGVRLKDHTQQNTLETGVIELKNQ